MGNEGATLVSVAERLNRDAQARSPHHLPPLILMTDEARGIDLDAAVARLPAGSAVIFRHYGAPDREAVGRDLRALCMRRRVGFLVARDVDLAVRLDADGFHAPENLAARVPDYRDKAGGLVTVAAHSAETLARAHELGAEAAILSPVFATRSHADAKSLGVARFADLVRAAPLPVYALGGVNDATAEALLGSGAVGIATVGGLSSPS